MARWTMNASDLWTSFPNQGIFSPRGKFLEVLTEKELLDERSRAVLDPIEAVLVVEPESNHFLPCHFHAVRTALHRKERNQGRLLRSMLLKLRFQADSIPSALTSFSIVLICPPALHHAGTSWPSRK